MQGSTHPPFEPGQSDAAEPLEPLEPPERAEPPERLFATLYADLHRLAERELRRAGGAEVSPTTLVHEAYLKFSGVSGAQFADRGRFLAYAGRAIRRLVIDFARSRQALKRGAGFRFTEFNTAAGGVLADQHELERLSDALDELARLDPRLAELVDLKFFCGFSLAEIALQREVSERTVQRDWEKARLALFADLSEDAVLGADPPAG